MDANGRQLQREGKRISQIKPLVTVQFVVFVLPIGALFIRENSRLFAYIRG
jgi:hypothetical protein